MPHVELPQAEFKVVMLGDTFTGKTSLVLRFAEGYYRDSARNATVGAFFITKRLSVQGMTCKVQIWDTAGQEQFRKLAPMYYKNAAAAIVCYDITSPKSYETMKYWIDELHQNFPAGGIVLAMCATKCDLATIPDTVKAEELALSSGSMFIKTSAKNNENVTDLFQKVAERVLQFQRQDVGGSHIPVTLGTTSVETPANAMASTDGGNPASNISPQTQMNGAAGSSSEHASPLTPEIKSKAINDGKKQQHNPAREEDDVIDPAESRESSKAESSSRCGADLLMCGDMVAADGATQGCIIL